MGKTFPGVYSKIYRACWRRTYIKMDGPPTGPGVVWRRLYHGECRGRFVPERTRGDFYRRVTDRKTGAVVYFKRDDADQPKSPAAKIDAEPAKQRRPHLWVGHHAWLIGMFNRWFLVKVIDRKGTNNACIIVASVTGWDAEREVPWPYGDSLEVRTTSKSIVRLQPLSARPL